MQEVADEAARQRQAGIDAARALAELAIEVEELTAKQASADTVVHRLRARVHRSGLEPIDRAGEETTFDPTEMRVYVLPYQGDPELPQKAMDWPLDTPLSAFGEPLANDQQTRCGVVTGDEFRQVYAAAQTANQLTPWVSDGTEYRLILRPLLPDEHTC